MKDLPEVYQQFYATPDEARRCPQCGQVHPGREWKSWHATLARRYPQAAVPYRLARILLEWFVVSLLGMICVGADTWQRKVDVFAIYFATLGRFAPLAVEGNSIVVRPPGRGLISEPAPRAAAP